METLFTEFEEALSFVLKLKVIMMRKYSHLSPFTHFSLLN